MTSKWSFGLQRRAAIPAVVLALAITCACAAACTVYAPGPVDIDTKTDVCARCRMTIDTVAHAGEIVTAEGNVRKYDSLGCLTGDYGDLTKAGRQIAGAWVIDYVTKGWLKAESAHYALANLPTDHMGFGAVATATREAALKLVGGDAAKVLDWKGLISHREGKAAALPETTWPIL